MGWVAGRVVSFFNLEVTKVSALGSGASARTLRAVAGAEEGSNINMTTNEMYKEPSKSIYINHHLVTYVNDSYMIT